MLGALTPADFVRTVRQAVRSAAPEASSSVVDLITAHAGLESGFGSGRAFKVANNLFNITRTSSDPAPVVLGPDTEYGPTGAPKPIVQRFAAYPSLEDSVRHYLTFISSPRYGAARAQLLAGDLSFIATLRAGGYFTLPLAQYQAGYLGALRTVQGEPDPAAAVAGAAPSSRLKVLGWIALAGGAAAAAGFAYFRGGT